MKLTVLSMLACVALWRSDGVCAQRRHLGRKLSTIVSALNDPAVQADISTFIQLSNDFRVRSVGRYLP